MVAVPYDPPATSEERNLRSQALSFISGVHSIEISRKPPGVEVSAIGQERMGVPTKVTSILDANKTRLACFSATHGAEGSVEGGPTFERW